MVLLPKMLHNFDTVDSLFDYMDCGLVMVHTPAISHADEVLKLFLLDHWIYVSKQKVCVVPGCYGIGWFSWKSWVWNRPDFSQLLRWPSS